MKKNKKIKPISRRRTRPGLVATNSLQRLMGANKGITAKEYEAEIRHIEDLAKRTLKHRSTGGIDRRVAVWQGTKLSDDQIVDLIDQAKDGNNHSESVLLILAFLRIADRKDPLSVWLAMRLYDEGTAWRGEGQPSSTRSRDAFIVDCVAWLLKEHPRLTPTRSRSAHEAGEATSACAIVKRGLQRAGIVLEERRVEEIWQDRAKLSAHVIRENSNQNPDDNTHRK